MAKKRYNPGKRLSWTILYFLITIGLLVAVFPKEAKLKFEIYKGKPWSHRELIAPFSFAVKKTKEQLKHEKDSLIQSAKKVFVWDDKQSQKYKKQLFERYFKGVQNANEKPFVDSLFRSFNKKYIIKPEQLELINQEEILLVKGRESEVLPIKSLYTPRKVYLECAKAIKNYKLKHNLLSTFSILDNIEFENYIVANIELNETLGQDFLNERLAKISPTKGLVQKGELIMSTGKIVNQKDYEILLSFKKEYEKRYVGSSNLNNILGTFIFVLIPFSLLFVFLFQFHKKLLMTRKKILFLLITTIVFVGFAAINHRYSLISVYLFPIIIYPILVRTFLDTKIASFSYAIILLLISYLISNSFNFFFVQFAAGIAGIYAFPHITKRSHLFNTSLAIMLVYILCYLALAMLQEENMSDIHWNNIGLLAVNSLLVMLTYPLVFMSEKLFGFTSDVTLLELSDTNQKLLKKLSEKTPGTFQHSLQVANIAEELIRSIGGNPLLVRTGALYHDIGKMKNPEYFTENQAGGFNPHQNLSPIESSRLVIKHVEDGIKLAKSYKLPQAVIDFIPMHQGTMATKYFLNTYKQTHSDFDESIFHYPGPIPNSKETAVVMIADSMEAASRSLKSYTKENIEELVNRIVDTQLNEGQFENVNMTFKDINTIKRTLVEKLASIYHSRVAYPEDKKKD